MTARHAKALLALALIATAGGSPLAQIATSIGPNWVPVDPQAMPGVFYDQNSILPVSERPTVMGVTVAWFYAQPRVSEANGQPYGSVTQPITLNCGANTYTVTEVRHHAGNDATGAIVESVPVPGIRNAPVTRDPVQRRLRDLICPAEGKSARK
ncbi:surface-adhesin E family protein [Achromobacter spanius]|uniref:surface-adhesin E family protein n=1 Tax=Achromobacter spanius TaxID=217203 RepID=UPI00320901FA